MVEYVRCNRIYVAVTYAAYWPLGHIFYRVIGRYYDCVLCMSVGMPDALWYVQNLIRVNIHLWFISVESW